MGISGDSPSIFGIERGYGQVYDYIYIYLYKHKNIYIYLSIYMSLYIDMIRHVYIYNIDINSYKTTSHYNKNDVWIGFKIISGYNCT